MDSRAAILFLFIVAYLIFANDTAVQISDVDPRTSRQSAVREARQLLDIAGNATYGGIEELLQANVTGFTHLREYNWKVLPGVQTRARDQVKHALGADDLLNGESTLTPQLYSNITGSSQGRWMRSPIWQESDKIDLNVSYYFGDGARRRFDRNFTHTSGDITFSFREKELPNEVWNYTDLLGKITTLGAEMVLTEDQTEQEEEVPLRGVYFPEIGHGVLSTTSSKFTGLFLLPLLAVSPYTFETSRFLLNDTITRMMSRDDSDTTAINPWGGGTTEPQSTPKCEMIVYLQQIPPAEPHRPLRFLDKELRYPTGTIVSAPKMHFSALIFSPDCGFILESQGPPDVSARVSDHLSGYKRESLQSRARSHMLAYGIVALLQLITLIRQMRESSTPSTKSRVSFYTIAAMVFGDAFATINFITISLFVETIWLTIMSTAFFCLASMLMFGMRFLSDIWAVHAPERRRQEQATTANSDRLREEALQAARERVQAAYSVTAPQPATADAVPPVEPVDFGSIPLYMPSDQAGLQNASQIQQRPTSFGTVYLRFSFLLIMTLFVSISAVSFPGTLRNLYFTSLTMAYLSYWTPQIWRNAWRNSRRALRWEFVICQSLLRLVPVAYFFGWNGNVLFTDSRPITLAIMFAWVWLQVVVLASQEIVGPRWFVKESWLPPAWEYHPILQTDVEGFQMPLGLNDSSSSSPVSPRLRRSSSHNEHRHPAQRTFDCAICMQELEVPIAESIAERNSMMSASFLLARRAYMVTPCRHIFHSKCLEGWMKYRMQCPICREELPL